MDQNDSRGETGLSVLGAQKSTSISPSPGLLSLPSLAVRRPVAQHSVPQQVIDQRRHTVDFSAWSSMGKICDTLPSGSNVKSLLHLTNLNPGASTVSNPTKNTRSAWTDSQNDSSAYESLKLKGPSRDSCAANISEKNFPSSLDRLHQVSTLFGEGDMFARRASLSQLSVFDNMWGQPDPVSLHKHSNSLEISSSNEVFSAIAIDSPKNSSDGVFSSSYDNFETEQRDGTLDQRSQPITSTVSLSSKDKLNCLTLEDHYSQQAHIQRQISNSQHHHQQSPQLMSNRWNSRIHPNPIQPPKVSHAKKASIDEQGINIQQPSQGHIQHGGFVSGFDIWSNRGEKHSLDPNGGVRLDLLNHRRKSESVLHDLSDFSSLHFDSYHSNNASVANPSISAVSASSTRSASPLDPDNSYQQATSGIFGEGSSMKKLSGPLSSDLHLHPFEQDINSAGGDSRLTTSQFKSSQPSLHPHFASIPDSASANRQGVVGNLNEMCGLCSVQRANVSMGSCGHRVCNVCHRHEKHRALRLFQNETPPCPFCAHGVATVLQTTLTGDNHPQSQFGTDSTKQHQPLLPQMNQLSYVNQQQQHRYTSQKQSHGPEDIGERYPQNRQYHYTFPGYSATPTTLRLRSSSTQLDNAPLMHSLSSGNNNNTTGALFSHGSQAPLQNIYLKSQQSNFSVQTTTSDSSNQHHLVQFQHQRPPQSSGLNHHAPKFQPANGTLLGANKQEQASSSLMGRPGMVSPPTGSWREAGMTSMGSDYGFQELQYSQQHYSSQAQITHMQQRRGSQQHSFHPTSGGTSVHHQTHSYCAGGNGINGNITGTSMNTSLSFSILPNLPPAVPPTSLRTEAIQWAVVRVTNIPWDVSLQDMHAFFSGFPQPPEHLLSQNVHILMDRATGKTFNSAFVELALTSYQAGMVASARNLKVLKGRLVTVELSSQDELLRAVFPKWTGQFLQGEPTVTWIQRQNTQGVSCSEEESYSSSGGGQRTSGGILSQPSEVYTGSSANSSSTNDGLTITQNTSPFITREEINALLVVCRNYKLHFSRKCAERPFENILSILAKYPWHQPHRVQPLHRDHIFELLKLSIESLRTHLSKEYNTIHPTLLTRMVRSAIFTPAFTERQKAMVLHVAGCACPEDIVGWMSPPVPIEAESSDEDKTSIDSNNVSSEDVITKQIQEATSSSDHSSKPTLLLKSEDKLQSDGQIESLGISGEPSSVNTPIYQQPTKTSSSPTPSPGDTNKSPSTVTPSTNDDDTIALINKSETGYPEAQEVKTTIAPSATSSKIASIHGARNMSLAPSYAAAVTKKSPSTLSYGNQVLATSPDKIPAAIADSALLSRSSSDQHQSNRSSSLCNFPALAAPNTLPVFELTKSLDYENPTGDQSLHGGSFSKQKQEPLTQAKNTLPITSSASPISTQATTPVNTSPLSLSPVISSIHTHDSSKTFSNGTVPLIFEEKTKSESIMDAIKTITQSTPRLSKPCLLNHMNNSNSGTSLSSTVAEAAMGEHDNRQQRCEGGETL
ncbi:hypothetical protein BGZ46_010690 [Entomortierella lignicola]|nr:hypothetical protein BGZ46_010690 [Entomortierella lignicola]